MTTSIYPSPHAPLEWVRSYRRRRRRQLGSEEAFQRHVRILWRHSGYVRHKGWKVDELTAALGQVKDEPVPEARPGQVEGGTAASAKRRSTQAMPQRAIGTGRRCIDCGEALPADRQRKGRCERCRECRARGTARRRMRRHRAEQTVEDARHRPVERRSEPHTGGQKRRSLSRRAKVPTMLRS